MASAAAPAPGGAAAGEEAAGAAEAWLPSTVVAEDVMEELLHVVLERCEAIDEFDEAEAASVEDAVGSCLGGVGVPLMQRQEWAVERASLALQNWTTCGSEPACTPVDTWARGVVPVHHRKVETKASGRPIDRLRRLSAGLTGLGLFAKHDKGSDRTIRRASAMLPSMSNVGIKPLSQRGHLPTLRTHPSKSSSFIGSKANGSHSKLTEEEEREQRLREEIELRKQAEFARQRQAEKDHEELVQLEILQKDLRGKEYSYDHNGNVVVLSPLNPDKLPRPAVVPRISVADDAPVGQPPAAGAGAGGHAGHAGAKEKSSTSSRRLLARENVDFIELQQDLQPSLTEHIKVSDGVVFREGGKVKAGGVMRPPGNSMTRREYVSMVADALPSSTTEASEDAQGSAGRDGALSSSSRRPRGGAATRGAAAPRSGADVRREHRRAQQQRVPAWVTDGRQIEDSVVAQERKDENLELISSPDWGRNPHTGGRGGMAAKPPKRDSSMKARKEAVGEVVIMPRERPYGKVAAMNKQMRSLEKPADAVLGSDVMQPMIAQGDLM